LVVVQDEDGVAYGVTGDRRWAWWGSGDVEIEEVGIAVCWSLCAGGSGQ
jgi:hypothetical protein